MQTVSTIPPLPSPPPSGLSCATLFPSVSDNNRHLALHGRICGNGCVSVPWNMMKYLTHVEGVAEKRPWPIYEPLGVPIFNTDVESFKENIGFLMRIEFGAEVKLFQVV
ncbi:hypothetical protein AVEN_45241-1 [Araneus ventricosus]|uniref:Uncharacterized protein n=1 Tax=Araneus ventricosus TaxID=182803 RepID=A0A4Y2NCV2_ARAVE|nr:hypothetical protein AVEN_45241-1 [Araneus ventricosus]